MIAKLLSYSVLLLIIGIFSTATSSIAIQCSNSNPEFKVEHPSNFNFIVVNLVSAVSGILIAIIGIFLSIQG